LSRKKLWPTLRVTSGNVTRFFLSQRLNPIANRVLLKKLSCEYRSSLRVVAYDSRIALRGPSIDPSDILRCQLIAFASQLFTGDYAELDVL
jgi:hypothetical protein